MAKASFARALRVTNTLMRQSEDRGCRVTTRDTETRTVRTADEIPAAVKEFRRPIKAENPSWRQGGYDHVLTGLRSSKMPWIIGRSRWPDGKRKRLENQLVDFVVELVQEADRTRAVRERQTEAQHAAAHRERLRALQARRVDRLSEQLADWRTAKDLQAFSAELAVAIEKARCSSFVGAAPMVSLDSGAGTHPEPPDAPDDLAPPEGDGHAGPRFNARSDAQG